MEANKQPIRSTYKKYQNPTCVKSNPSDVVIYIVMGLRISQSIKWEIFCYVVFNLIFVVCEILKFYIYLEWQITKKMSIRFMIRESMIYSYCMHDVSN